MSLPYEYSSERFRKLIDFNKTEPEVLRKLIEHASRRSRELEELIVKQKALGEEVLTKMGGIIGYSKIRGDPYAGVIGVDGSNQVVGGRSGNYYIMLSAVVVHLPHGIGTRNPVVKYPDVTIVSFNDPSGEVVSDVAEDAMMLLETRAIVEAVSIAGKGDGVLTPLFIDGPIIDPPRSIRSESITVFKQIIGDVVSVDVYYGLRTSALIEAYRKNVLPIGFVKKPGTDKLLLRIVGEEVRGVYKVFSGDEELVRTILALEMIRNPPSKGYIYYTVPREYPSDNTLYSRYKELGLSIYYSYSMHSPYSRPFRVEVALPRIIPLRKAYELTVKAVMLSHILTLPGQKYPLPVLLAHEKCRIRRGAAELIYEEILAKTVKPSGDRVVDVLKTVLVEEEE